MTNRIMAKISILGSIALGHGCATPRSTISDVKPKVEVPATKSTSLDQWLPTLASTDLSYSIQDSSIISINNDSLHSSNIQSNTNVTLRLQATADSFALEMTVDSVTASAHTNAAKMPTSLVQNFVATIQRGGRLSLLTQKNSPTCTGGIDPVATRIFELTVSYPNRPIRIGEHWADTISTTTCRGKNPLDQRTIRQYELVDLLIVEGKQLAKIRKSVNTSISGMSTDIKNHLTATGDGFGSTILYVDRATGSLLRSDGHTRTTLLISTGRGTYPFSQTVSTHIERL